MIGEEDTMRRLRDLVGSMRARTEARRARGLRRAIAEKQMREHQDPSIWRSGKGGAHHDR